MEENTLQNIFNVVVAHENVNVNKFFENTLTLIYKVEGKSLFKFSFKGKRKSLKKAFNKQVIITVISTTVSYINIDSSGNE